MIDWATTGLAGKLNRVFFQLLAHYRREGMDTGAAAVKAIAEMNEALRKPNEG